MSFIFTDQITILGMFSPNGFRTIKPGAEVKLVFDDDPGRIHEATIAGIPKGTGQGQIAVSGTLARAGSIRGAKTYPAVISIRRTSIAAGSGSVCLARQRYSAEKAGVIGLIMSILVWVSSYAAYL